MAFVRKKVASVKWPVKVSVPSDGGTFETQTFQGVFKLVGRKEIMDLADNGDEALITQVLEGWEEIEDETGKEISFTKKNLKDFMDDHHWTRGVVKALMEMVDEAPSKN
jgi:hypothetical protein